MRAIWGLFLLVIAASVHAAELRELRLVEGPDSTRVVFDLDRESAPKVFTLANPDRVVIDFADATRAAGLQIDSAGRGLVKAVRSGPRDKGLRIVLDVGAPASPQSFGLQPSGAYGYRLIVDLYPQNAAAPDAAPARPAATQITAAAEPTPAPALSAPAAQAVQQGQAAAANPSTVPKAAPVTVAAAQAIAPPPTAAATPVPAPPVIERTVVVERPAPVERAPAPEYLRVGEKPIVVAIDAGHGGEDPGARGPSGLLEKDVTLAIARKLARRIDAQPGMRAVLTRDGDYYVDLRQRTIRAREAQADLFVSVHCNALVNRSMRGTAVYVLSDHGASSEQARWIANHENAADLVGGVKLQNKDNDLAAVLIDISQSATMEASFDLGSRLLDSLGKVNSLQKAEVQQAGFMVLKSPDIPSVLVETAFISNPNEERLLGSGDYQDRLAGSIFDGVRGYFSRYRPLQQVAAAPEHPALRAARAKPVPVSLNRSGTD